MRSELISEFGSNRKLGKEILLIALQLSGFVIILK